MHGKDFTKTSHRIHNGFHLKETSKASRRRASDSSFDWGSVFIGKGLDVGSGDDPLIGAETIDISTDGRDANILESYFEGDRFDFIHASQVLEHLIDPMKSIKGWSKVLKTGGYIIVTVPDFELYEKRTWPSRFNPDHKTAWTMNRLLAGNGVPLIHVPDFLNELSEFDLKAIRVELIVSNYDFSLDSSIDQTRHTDGAECFIEFVLKKISSLQPCWVR